MAEAREFKPLKEVGAIPLSDTSELKYYVDEYRCYKYASIRTFVTGEGYSCPTKSGVTMNPTILEGVIAAMAKLPAEPEALEEKELARFDKKMGIKLVVRITIFRDSTGVDLREWVDEEGEGGYKGWSKKGVRIPYKDIAKSIAFLKEMQKLVVKA